MSEDKKTLGGGLTPEQEDALEKVTGGTIDISDLSDEQQLFIAVNCIGCAFEGPGTCPYGGNNKKAAIPKAMSEGGTKCVKKELPKV